MTIEAFYQLSEREKKELLFQCCGSTNWVNKMVQLHPAQKVDEFLTNATDQWQHCTTADFLEACAHHPKIGDVEGLRKKFSADQFAGKEQSGVNNADETTLRALAEGNTRYEEKFGYIFIVFATGKSAKEMLEILSGRLKNTPGEEIYIAMKEQSNITRRRLQNLFNT